MNVYASIQQLDSLSVKYSLRLENKIIASFTATGSVPLRANPTALVAAFMPIAARMGHDLCIEGSVDGKAIKNSGQASSLLAEWHNNLSKIQLTAASADSRTKSDGVACLASLGLDSLYCLRALENEITHMVLYRGFDIGLENDILWQKTVDICEKIAQSENKKLIILSTNIREVSDTYLHWQSQFIGAALASMAHLLDDYFSQLIIPSSYSSDRDSVWGTHSLLDALWSSSRLNISHYPKGVNRVEKLRALKDDSYVKKYLRVCNQNTNTVNCGKCEKCIRTICNALAVGMDGQLQTLSTDITASDIENMPLWPSKVEFHEENLEYLRRLPAAKRRKDIETALEKRIAKCMSEVPVLAHLQ